MSNIYLAIIGTVIIGDRLGALIVQYNEVAIALLTMAAAITKIYIDRKTRNEEKEN